MTSSQGNMASRGCPPSLGAEQESVNVARRGLWGRLKRAPGPHELTIALALALVFHFALVVGAFYLPPYANLELDLGIPGKTVVESSSSYLSGRSICFQKAFESAVKYGVSLRLRIWDDGKGYREYTAREGKLGGPLPDRCPFIGWGHRSYRVEATVFESSVATSVPAVIHVGIPNAAKKIDFWIFLAVTIKYHVLAAIVYWLIGLVRLRNIRIELHRSE